MILGCADLSLNELISIIAKLQGKNMLEEGIHNMDHFKRCNYLKTKPVLLACHFQHRVETFFKVTAVDVSLDEVKYHEILVMSTYGLVDPDPHVTRKLESHVELFSR